MAACGALTEAIPIQDPPAATAFNTASRKPSARAAKPAAQPRFTALRNAASPDTLANILAALAQHPIHTGGNTMEHTAAERFATGFIDSLAVGPVSGRSPATSGEEAR